MTTTIVIVIILIIVIFYLKNKPVKNSHKIPQEVKLIEFNNPENDPQFEGVFKGYDLKLSRELGSPAYNLYLTLDTNGEDLSELKMIIISWSEWKERIFDFKYFPSDSNVQVEKGRIKIDIGSFNNSQGSKNFLERTAASQLLKVDLLNYVPKHGDFEYETDSKSQSVFCPFLTKNELTQFKKGLHYLDS